MGAPKEGVRLADGRPMVEHVREALAAVCEQVVIVGECRGYETGRITRLPDLRPGLGPLAGIEAALSSGLSAGYLIAACDQPFLTPELLRRLVGEAEEPRCFREEGGAGFHPFPCYFPASWLPRVQEALDGGRLSMRGLLGENQPHWPVIASEEAVLLRSVNRPEDLG
jgi:molybdopterin-guanine dinucleotide biosynthesis protein A